MGKKQKFKYKKRDKVILADFCDVFDSFTKDEISKVKIKRVDKDDTCMPYLISFKVKGEKNIGLGGVKKMR